MFGGVSPTGARWRASWSAAPRWSRWVVRRAPRAAARPGSRDTPLAHAALSWPRRTSRRILAAICDGRPSPALPENVRDCISIRSTKPAIPGSSLPLTGTGSCSRRGRECIPERITLRRDCEMELPIRSSLLINRDRRFHVVPRRLRPDVFSLRFNPSTPSARPRRHRPRAAHALLRCRINVPWCVYEGYTHRSPRLILLG